MRKQFLKNCYLQAGDRCAELADLISQLKRSRFSKGLLADAVSRLEERLKHYAALRLEVVRLYRKLNGEE
jgi:hypothetical protein